jgi:hypothetical protein
MNDQNQISDRAEDNASSRAIDLTHKIGRATVRRSDSLNPQRMASN